VSYRFLSTENGSAVLRPDAGSSSGCARPDAKWTEKWMQGELAFMIRNGR